MNTDKNKRGEDKETQRLCFRVAMVDIPQTEIYLLDFISLYPRLSAFICGSKAFSFRAMTCTAVRATTLATSSAEQPRERSFAGRSSPCRIGPSACAPPSLST